MNISLVLKKLFKKDLSGQKLNLCSSLAADSIPSDYKIDSIRATIQVLKHTTVILSTLQGGIAAILDQYSFIVFT
jgi:hypothetical protein